MDIRIYFNHFSYATSNNTNLIIFFFTECNYNMEIKNFLLLDIDYITTDNSAVIRLFGKLIGDNTEKSIIAMDKHFKPYFYVLPYDVKRCEDDLADFELEKVEEINKMDNGVLKDFLKVTVKHPQDVPKIRDKILKLSSVKEIREHDIPFYRRYLIDNGLFPMETVKVEGKISNSIEESIIFEINGSPENLESELPRLNILSFDIEACNPRGMPVVREDPINMISFSTSNGYKKVFSTKKSGLRFVETVSDETELLKKFTETIKEQNPDIILGYNTDGFDFPYIHGRAEKLGVSLDLGVDGSPIRFVRRGFRDAAHIKGRVHIDLYPSARRFLELDRHTLERVYNELFGEDKLDIPGDEIHTCWNSEGEKLEQLFKYSLDDAVAVTRIGEKILPLNVELTRIVGQPLFDVTRMATGQQVEWYLIRRAFGIDLIVPNKPPAITVSSVEGAYVKEPVKGLHENIVYFDFKSLYPSIIISKNISPDTLTESTHDNEYFIAPEFGFKFRKTPQGFIPSVIGEILQERSKIKSIMKTVTDDEQLQILDVQQQALKRLANTIYGLYNHNTFRWHNSKCSESITAWGREYIKMAMKESKKYNFKPLYADTDGFYATYTENIHP